MTATFQDPVCGVIVDSTTAAGKSVYNGVTYYFDSLSCKASFDLDPAKYVGSGTGTQSADSPPIARH